MPKRKEPAVTALLAVLAAIIVALLTYYYITMVDIHPMTKLAMLLSGVLAAMAVCAWRDMRP